MEWICWIQACRVALKKEPADDPSARRRVHRFGVCPKNGVARPPLPPGLTRTSRLHAAAWSDRLIRETKPTFLINAAGYTGKPNVDACEKHKADWPFEIQWPPKGRSKSTKWHPNGRNNSTRCSKNALLKPNCGPEAPKTSRGLIFDYVWTLPGSICDDSQDSLHRFLLLIVVFARSGTHIAESSKLTCQESANNRQESPRANQEPYGSTTLPTHPLTLTHHNLQKLWWTSRTCIP